ncbi:hypothetical protein ABGB19_16030 [Mycobacterium sp. B14F4]|uniref:hypothetical protein n=1 Tax=Mycobacterium sp. B14F4 TaxID=3153565 RepID=UPI00325D6935
MTDEDWHATDQGRAIDAFLKYSMSIALSWAGSELGGLLTGVIGVMGKSVLDNPELWRKLGRTQEQIERLQSHEKYIRMLDPKYDQAVRSSILVIGACSAIEACIEDMSKGIIRRDPSILDGTRYDATAVAQKHVLTDADETLDKQWRRIENTVDKELSLCERFEAMLAVIHRDGPVPQVIADDFNTAYAIRNVWAHNAGYADANFIAKAPQLEFQLGDLVTFDVKDGTTSRYLSVVLTYGMIVANRDRAAHGLDPIPMEGKPGETDFGQAYRGLYA